METADIFPAYKLVQMVYFLLLIYPMYQREHVSEKPDDCLLKYLNMVASYVAYMHLFNSSCGVRMEKTWNKAIGNEYVYITKEKVNVLEEEKIMIQDNDALAYLTGCEIGKDPAAKNLKCFLRGFASVLKAEDKYEAVMTLIGEKSESNKDIAKVTKLIYDIKMNIDSIVEKLDEENKSKIGEELNMINRATATTNIYAGVNTESLGVTNSILAILQININIFFCMLASIAKKCEIDLCNDDSDFKEEEEEEEEEDILREINSCVIHIDVGKKDLAISEIDIDVMKEDSMMILKGLELLDADPNTSKINIKASTLKITEDDKVNGKIIGEPDLIATLGKTDNGEILNEIEIQFTFMSCAYDIIRFESNTSCNIKIIYEKILKF